MEVQVRERLVGALVLVAIVVLFVPALLKGPRQSAKPEPVPAQQSVEVDLQDPELPAQEDQLVPEPEPTPAAALPVMESAVVPAPAPPPDPEPARAPVATEQAAWAVQLGAFSARDKAEGLVRDLRRRGYSAFVLEYRAEGKVLHRVRVGPEQERSRADAIAERLRKDGFLPVVRPHP